MPNKDENDASRATGLILRWPTPRSKRWTDSFLESTRTNPNIMAVVATGSAVRPEVTANDLDLVVICNEPKDLQVTRPMEVDLRVYCARDVGGQIRNGHDVLGWAVKFGRVLFQRCGFWNRIVDCWRGDLPLPASDIARKRAEDTYRRLSKVYELGDSSAAREQAVSYLTHLAWAALYRKRRVPSFQT